MNVFLTLFIVIMIYRVGMTIYTFISFDELTLTAYIQEAGT